MTYALAKANTKKITAVTTVPRCKNKSIPRAFLFPNNCSAPPEIAPDKPALVPDCKTISVIIIIILMTKSTLITVAIYEHTFTHFNETNMSSIKDHNLIILYHKVGMNSKYHQSLLIIKIKISFTTNYLDKLFEHSYVVKLH